MRLGKFHGARSRKPPRPRGRTVSDSVLRVHPDLPGKILASPRRRLAAFLIDGLILLIPSLALALAAAALSLHLTDPGALEAMNAVIFGGPMDESEESRNLAAVAPILMELQAPGFPPAAAVALEEGDTLSAGEILRDYDWVITLSVSSESEPIGEGLIRIEVDRLIPSRLRAFSLFGLAALYFVFFTTGRRRATPGKWMLRMQVLRLDGAPLTVWQSFERFGGYMASLGTLGVGLLDFWLDRNRRLAHDRIAHTVVVRKIREK